MGQFDHITKQTKASETVRFEMPEIDGTPWLEVAQATEANTSFLNAALRFRNVQRRGFRPGTVGSGQVDRARRTDLVLFSKHVVKGWGNITDKAGVPVEFNEQNCREFLEAIPSWLFNDLRQFCINPINFIENGDLDYGATAKN